MESRRWRGILAFTAAFVLVAACSSSSDKTEVQPSASHLGPKIAADAKYDFGKAMQGEVVEHVFKIRNEGDEELRIENVHTSCGCTAALVTTAAIPPGGEGEIKASLKTEGRKGAIKKTVAVTSNAVNAPSFVLELSGEIVVDVEVEPARLSLGELRKDEGKTIPFTVKIHEPEKYKLGGLRVADPRFSIEDKGDFSYELQFKGSSTLESISSKLIVDVQGERSRAFEVPISVRVVGDIVHTRNLYFLKRNGKIENKEIKLSSRSGRAIKVFGASDPDGVVKLTVPKKPGKELSVQVAVVNPSDNFKQPRRGTIIVRTDDKDMPEISVSYTVSEPRAPIINLDSATKNGAMRVLPPLPEQELPSASASTTDDKK